VGFVIGVGAVLAIIIVFAAVMDWQTRRSGRRPRGAADTSALIRNAHRRAWRARVRGTKFEELFPDVKEGPDVYGYNTPPTRSKATAPFGTPPGVYEMPSTPARRRRGR